MVWYIFVLLAWSVIWKGIALWHAARRGEKVWFGVLMVVNTVGILEIIYLLFVAHAFRAKEVVVKKSQHKPRKKQ